MQAVWLFWFKAHFFHLDYMGMYVVWNDWLIDFSNHPMPSAHIVQYVDYGRIEGY